MTTNSLEMQPFACYVSKLRSWEGKGWLGPCQSGQNRREECLSGEQGSWELAQGWEQRAGRREERKAQTCLGSNHLCVLQEPVPTRIPDLSLGIVRIFSQGPVGWIGWGAERGVKIVTN